MKTELRKKAKKKKKKKKYFEKYFFKLMNNSVFGKTTESVRKYRNIKLVSTEKRRNYLASEPSYHTTKVFFKNLIAVEMKKNTNIHE